MTLTATVAKDKRNEWRWTIQSRNGRIVGASSEGYKNRGMCLRNLALITARKTDGFHFALRAGTLNLFRVGDAWFIKGQAR